MPIAKNPHSVHCTPPLPIYLGKRRVVAFALEIFDGFDDREVSQNVGPPKSSKSDQEMFDLAEADRLETQHPDAMACAKPDLSDDQGVIR